MLMDVLFLGVVVGLGVAGGVYGSGTLVVLAGVLLLLGLPGPADIIKDGRDLSVFLLRLLGSLVSLVRLLVRR